MMDEYEVAENRNHSSGTCSMDVLNREVDRSPENDPTLDESVMTGEQLYRQNMRFASRIASRFYRRWKGDSEHNGRILAAALRGMWHSTEKWKFGMSNFKTYASRRILWEIYDELGLKRRRDRFFDVAGERVQYDEGDSEEKVNDFHNYKSGAYSIGNVEDFMMKDVVVEALEGLKEDRMRDIIKVYYEIDTEGNNTYREISERHGITKQRVEQLLKKGIVEMRKIIMRNMAKKGLDREGAMEVLFGERE